MNEEDILYQNGRYWVARDKRGHYEVYRDGVTHAELCLLVGKNLGLERAKAEIEKKVRADKGARDQV